MKRFSTLRIACMAFLAAAVFCGTADAAAIKAKLTNVSGDVQTRASVSGAWSAAKQGAMLAEGAQIKCGAGAQAVVAWGKGNVIKVAPLSSITLSNLQDNAGTSTSKVSLDSGKLFAKSPKLSKGSSFEIKTPTAVAGVRGTGFEATPSSFSVVEGSVGVNNGSGEVEVPAGMMVEVPEVGVEISEPAPIPAETLVELEQVNTEVKEISAEIEASGGITEESEAIEEGGDTEEGDAVESDEPEIDTEAILDDAQMNDLVDQAENAGECPGCGSISGTIEF